MSSRPAPGARAVHSASAAAFASLSIPTGSPKRSDMRVAESSARERDVDRAERDARCAGRSATAARSRPRRTPSVVEQRSTALVERREQRSCEPVGVGVSRALDAPRRRGRRRRRGSSSRRGRRRSRALPSRGAATIPAAWPAKRSRTASTAAAARRARCRSPTRPRPSARATGDGRTGRPAPPKRAAPAVRWGRLIGDRAPGRSSCCSCVWAALELPRVRTRRRGREQAAAGSASSAALTTAGRAAARRRRRTSSCSAPTTQPHRARAGSNSSDSIMLIRTDPDRHRIAYLSIPRDLRVRDPGLRRREDQRGDADRRRRRSRSRRSRPDRARRSTTSSIVDFDDSRA